MKLTHLNVQNFLGVRAVDVPLTKPVTLFAGKNGAGKSSLQEAVRMALTGEAVRVAMKKDFAQLVSEGADSGFSEVFTQDDGVYSIVLPSGKGTCLADGNVLPFVLNAQRFASLDGNERRAFLFGLMGLSAGGAEVRRRMIERRYHKVACPTSYLEKIDTITPLLRAGFDAAHKEAQAKARDEKAAWRTITGETYGDKKAATWTAEKPAFDPAQLGHLQKQLEAADADLSAANQRMGALQADIKRHAEAAHSLAELREKGSRYARISEKLVRDEAELKDWEKKVADSKQLAAGGRKVGLVHDMAKSINDLLKENLSAGYGGETEVHSIARELLEIYVEQHGKIELEGAGDINAQNNLIEYEKALRMLQSAVANGKRDLADADAAARAVIELEAAAGSAPDEAEINAAKEALGEIAHKQQALSVSLDLARDAERKNKQAIGQSIKAQEAHQSAQEWLQIADALAPDGIPGEMLSEALTPLNERLVVSSNVAEWPRISVTPSMEIWADQRPYALLSESEKWRADAMLAEAIAHLSKIKLLVLDRFDVLDLKGREDLIAWLDFLAQDGEIDTAMIFGTLKALPPTLPQTIAAHWLENGVVAQLKEAV